MLQPVTSPVVSTLWFSATQADAARQRLADGHSLSVAIMHRAHQAVGNPHNVNWVGSAAAIALMEGEPKTAIALVDHLVNKKAYPQDLGLAHYGLQLAVAYDCTHGLLTSADHTRLQTTAAGVVRQLRTSASSHNPHAIQNNWWGVTHSGALLAAMVADENNSHTEDIRWALGRCLAFCQHFGPAGLYHEGLGYQMYTLSHLLPALAAADHRGYIDLRQECPWVMRLAESLFAFTSLCPASEDSSLPTSGHGLMLSWNDAGPNWSSSNVTPLMLAFADPSRRAALCRWSAHLEGEAAPGGGLYADWEGWPFALMLPPSGENGPLSRLRTHLSDPRQGLAVYRDRWQDGDDAVLGCYARTTHIGGHSHDDGGSVRLTALGHQWIVGGGQARGAATWQSVVTPSERDETPQKSGQGAVIWDEETSSGGVYGMDLRRVSKAYHERYCALAGNGAFGIPVIVALLDLIDDHRDRAWTWRITIGPSLTFTSDADGCGFTLTAPDGARAQIRLIGSRPLRLRRETCPESQRVFSHGSTVSYRERQVIAADFSAQPHLAIMTVITLSRATLPSPLVLHGVDVSIGEITWKRPFSAAVPALYDLARGGTLSRWPNGRIEG